MSYKYTTWEIMTKFGVGYAKAFRQDFVLDPSAPSGCSRTLADLLDL